MGCPVYRWRDSNPGLGTELGNSSGHAKGKPYQWADSSSVANTTSAQGAGEMDAEATTEADSGSCDRSAAERWLGRAGDRAGAWPLAQRDQYGDRAHGNYAAGSAQTAAAARRDRSGRRARLAPDGS